MREDERRNNFTHDQPAGLTAQGNHKAGEARKPSGLEFHATGYQGCAGNGKDFSKMKRSCTAARFYFATARRLAGLRAELRYWLNSSADNASEYARRYLAMIADARRVLRADLARAAK